MSTDLKNKVDEILREVFKAIDGEIDDNWGPDNIEGWDSMGHLNLVVVLGERFSISIDFEEVMSIETIGDIYILLNNKGVK